MQFLRFSISQLIPHIFTSSNLQIFSKLHKEYIAHNLRFVHLALYPALALRRIEPNIYIEPSWLHLCLYRLILFYQYLAPPELLIN